MAKQDVYLSLVIPAYNEEKRLVKTLEKIATFLKKEDYSYELILVDDGSTDNTGTLSRKLAQELSLNLTLIKNPKNLGKGGALIKGILASRGEIVMFTDADLSTPIEELNKFLPYLPEYEIVIGSRKMKGAKILVHQPFYREFMGKTYSWLARLILRVQVLDFTCGFKAFTKEAAKKIFSLMKVSNWSFDAELLYLAKKYGYKIKEVPVVWADSPNTRVRLLRDVFASFWGLIQIRLNDFKRLYDSF